VDPAWADEVAGADPKATECILNLVRTATIWMTAMTRLLRPYGLSPATFNVLMIVRGGPQPPHRIASDLLVTRGAITGLVSRLERAGLVRQSVDPTDARRAMVTITAEGKKRLRRVLPHLTKLEIDAVSDITTNAREQLVTELTAIAQGLTARADRDPIM
jgi:DNA-binding MarR family transcriptional regulator